MYAEWDVGHVLHLDNAAEGRCNFLRSSSANIHQRHSTSSDTRPWNSANFPHYSPRHIHKCLSKRLACPNKHQTPANPTKRNWNALHGEFIKLLVNLLYWFLHSFCLSVCTDDVSAPAAFVIVTICLDVYVKISFCLHCWWVIICHRFVQSPFLLHLGMTSVCNL